MLDVHPSYQLAGDAADVNTAGSVYALMRPSDERWNWNHAAIAEIALFGHTTGTNTLCEGIIRRPFDRQPKFDWNVDETIDMALEKLVSAFHTCVDGASAVHLSLSAGYDSRLLLALCLSQGVKPELSVMGYPDSTDVIVASAIAAKVGLPIRRIELRQEDYLEYGPQIAADTSGTKTAINWHTWLYAKALDAKDGVHLVGSNGEFARSFFLDNRRLNPLADRLPAGLAVGYWIARLTRRKMKFSRYNPLLSGAQAGPVRLATAGMRSLDWSPVTFADALDCFYTQQRVRHFIGAGLACYARFGRPRSPFLDDGWMNAVARMNRRLKRGSFFHAESVRRLAPELSEFAYNQLADGRQGRSYHPFAALCMTPKVTEMIADSAYLDTFATRAERLSILNDAACEQMEERNLWLTLHFASQPAMASA
jgi:hypothetical protein